MLIRTPREIREPCRYLVGNPTRLVCPLGCVGRTAAVSLTPKLTPKSIDTGKKWRTRVDGIIEHSVH